MDINQLTRIFCDLDDFCKEFNKHVEHTLLPMPESTAHRRGPSCRLSDSEIMTILISFHSSKWRHFKSFYTGFLTVFWKKEFPCLPSYNRFIEIMHRVFYPLVLFIQLRFGKQTGWYFVDSTCLPVCHIKRSRRHKVFRSIAEYGCTSVSWFFGLKLHIVINHLGELVAFKITRGNEHDGKASESFLERLKGIAFGDKGYLGKALFERLLERGLKLVTRVRKNMKAVKYSALEKQLLNQRGIIETVINHLKNSLHIWHTRHRSMANAITHLLAGLAAYVIEPLKISAIKRLASGLVD